MKYIYFDISSGFTPVMALGALIDMFKEESYVNEVLHPFAASVYTQTVSRGCFEGCLAHIDLSETSTKAYECCRDDSVMKLAKEFTQLSPNSDLRETLEAVCVCKLIESFKADNVYYSNSVCDTGLGFMAENADESINTVEIPDSGYALLKLLKSTYGTPQNGEINLVGYGADSIGKNPEGILRAVMYEENQSGLFMEGRAFETLFAEETAIL